MPIIGSAIYGFGQMLTYFPIQLYLVDTFTYAASAVSAAAVSPQHGATYKNSR